MFVFNPCKWRRAYFLYHNNSSRRGFRHEHGWRGGRPNWWFSKTKIIWNDQLRKFSQRFFIHWGYDYIKNSYTQIRVVQVKIMKNWRSSERFFGNSSCFTVRTDDFIPLWPSRKINPWAPTWSFWEFFSENFFCLANNFIQTFCKKIFDSLRLKLQNELFWGNFVSGNRSKKIFPALWLVEIFGIFFTQNFSSTAMKILYILIFTEKNPISIKPANLDHPNSNSILDSWTLKIMTFFRRHIF